MAHTRDTAGLAGPIVQRVFSGLILAIMAQACLVGLLSVHAAQRIYPYSVPFVASTIVCCLVGVIALVKNYLGLALTLNATVVVSFALFVLAVMNWSGGDDGPGMFLVWFGGFTMLSAIVLAVIAAITILIVRCAEAAKERDIYKETNRTGRVQ